MTKTTQRSTGEEFFIINIPEIRRAAISFERIKRKKERKKRVQTTDGVEAIGGIEEIIAKNIYINIILLISQHHASRRTNRSNCSSK